MLIHELNQKVPPTKKHGDDDINSKGSVHGMTKSPGGKKEIGDNGSPSASKSKYKPSRYGTADVHNAANPIKRAQMLHTLENNMTQLDNNLSKLNPELVESRLKEAKGNQPQLTKFVPNEFKKRPIKKADMDFQMYQEIFIAPKEQVLHQLKEKEKAFENLFHSGASRQYDKVLSVSKEENTPRYGFQETSKPGNRNKSPDNPHNKTKSMHVTQSHKTIRNDPDLAKSMLNDSKSETKLLRDKESLKNITIPGGIIDMKINDNDLNDALGEPVKGNNAKNNKAIHNERVFFDQQIQVCMNLTYELLINKLRCNLQKHPTLTQLPL